MSRIARPSVPKSVAGAAPRRSADAPAASTPSPARHWPYGGSNAQAEDAADAQDPSLHPVRVLSSAAQAGVHKPAGVPASVFDAGRLAKQAQTQAAAALRVRCAPLDLDKLVIDTDVPPTARMEARAENLRATCLALLARMQPGHSVVLPEAQGRALCRVAHRAHRKVSRRSFPDGTWRVWRLADPQGTADAVGAVGAVGGDAAGVPA